jgi:polar amino acid transport system substrate-binding protein
MAITYEQLQGWGPGDLDAAAEELNASVRKKLLDQQDEMDGGKIPGSWVGASADAATLRHDKLTEGLNDMAAPVAEVINVLDQVAPQIKSAKAAAKSAHQAITAKGYQVEVATSATVATSPPAKTDEDMSEEEAEAIKRQVEEFQRDLLDALQKAERADANLASVLTSATKNQFDGGTGSIQQAGLPPELRGLSDEEVATRIVADPEKYDGFVDALTPAQQRALGAAIAEEMGLELKTETGAFDTLIQGVKSERYDVLIASMTPTEERDNAVDFSDSYYTSGATMFVANDSDCDDPAAMDSPKVGVASGTTYQTFLEDEGLAGEVVTFTSDITALQDVDAGRLDGAMTDRLVGLYQIEKADRDLRACGDPRYTEEPAFAVDEGNTALLNQLNDALSTIKEDGTYAEISEKWFGQDIS